MDRSVKPRHGIDRSMKILEFGPAYFPICRRADGWNAFTFDYASQEELREKYRDQGVDLVDAIGHVDFVSRGGPVLDCIPAAHHGTFDAVLASHVIEHFPDPIGWFRDLSTLTTPSAIVSLVVPDKRWCFDFFRPLTTAGHWMEANRARRTRHTRAARFEYETYAILNDGGHAWGQGPLQNPRFAAAPPDAAHAIFATDPEAGAYIDCHAWCFTPSSFELLITELHALGEIDFRPVHSYPSEGCEFFMTLERSADREVDVGRLQARRMALMLAAGRELKEQLDMLPPR